LKLFIPGGDDGADSKQENSAGVTDKSDKSDVDKLTDEMGSCCSSERSGKPSSDYAWEQKLMVDKLLKPGKLFRAAIVSLSDGELRASGPKEFRPDPKGVQDIIKALEGDTSGIAENMINLGGGCPLITPGKVDPGKAIYGADGQGGGCAIFKTKECVLIAVYRSKPAESTRLASEVAEYMEEDNNK